MIVTDDGILLCKQHSLLKPYKNSLKNSDLSSRPRKSAPLKGLQNNKNQLALKNDVFSLKKDFMQHSDDKLLMKITNNLALSNNLENNHSVCIDYGDDNSLNSLQNQNKNFILFTKSNLDNNENCKDNFNKVLESKCNLPSKKEEFLLGLLKYNLDKSKLTLQFSGQIMRHFMQNIIYNLIKNVQKTNNEIQNN